VNPEKEHAVASCDHWVVKDSEIMSSDDDGVALAVKDGDGVGGVAFDLHCHSCISHSLATAGEDRHWAVDQEVLEQDGAVEAMDSGHGDLAVYVKYLEIAEGSTSHLRSNDARNSVRQL
jgi:hypothetical protein